jgi:enoyl-CoA hydratase/carnithine racemase
METPKTLLFEIREHVAHITLNRPDVSNAMNLEMAREFYEAAFECERSSDLRAVLITGAGRAFCSGGDVKSFAAREPSRLPAYYLPAYHAVSASGHPSLRPHARARGDGGQWHRRWRRDEPGVRGRYRTG